MNTNEFIPEFIKSLINRFESSGFEAYAVGGCIRDRLLGMHQHDWDMCTSAAPDEVYKVLDGFEIIPTGIRHGTVTVITPDGSVEVTTFRGDGEYTDSRHPESVRFINSLTEDLKRRDFTINAMAYSDRSGLVDIFGGKADLKAGILRCVGEPEKRFTEDALRIIRALRFSAVYKLSIEASTASAIHICKNGLKNISAERIYAELKKIFALAEHPGMILRDYFDILAVLFPEFTPYLGNVKARKQALYVIDNLPGGFSLRMSGLLYFLRLSGADKDEYKAAASSAVTRLKPTKKTYRRIMKLVDVQDCPLPDSLKATRLFINKYGEQPCRDFIAWKTACGFDAPAARTEEFLNRICEDSLCCSVSDLAVNGRDLISIGVPGGEMTGYILNLLLTEVINDNLKNERTALLNRAVQYLQKA